MIPFWCGGGRARGAGWTACGPKGVLFHTNKTIYLSTSLRSKYRTGSEVERSFVSIHCCGLLWFAQEVLEIMKNGTCAIVGNAGHLRLTEFGNSIDSHDVVIRLNAAPTIGYEKFVGTRTHVR
eukprot:1180627-Prorocentrum_minimum.AAC.1